MNPPYFKGESQPLVAEHWLRAIEKIFQTMRCEEDEKVNLATFMLEERTDFGGLLCYGTYMRMAR